MGWSNKQRAVGGIVTASRKLMDYRQRSEAEGASEELLAELDAMNAQLGDMIRELEKNSRTFEHKGPRAVWGDEE